MIEDYFSYYFSKLFNVKNAGLVKLRSLLKTMDYLQADRTKTPESNVGEGLSVNFLVHGLLNGRFRIPVFDRLSALHISDDSRLIRCYRRSSSDSLTAFLKLRRNRLKIREYGPTSEKKLRKDLTAYIKRIGIYDIEITAYGKIEVPKNVFSTSAIQSEEILHAVISSPKPEWFLNDSVWRQWLLKLKERNLTGVRICNLCQEIGVKWPNAPGWDKKTIEDFCSYSFSELSNLKILNIAKLRSLIKAIATLETNRQNTPEPDAGKELSVDFLVDGLLNGQFRIPIFDQMSAFHISDNPRLIRCYRRSSSDSLTAFLKLGRDRLEQRNYGLISENKLREALTKYIKLIGIGDIEITDQGKIEIPKSVISPSATELEQILHAIIHSPTPEWFLNNSIWRQCVLRLKEQNLNGVRIYNLCQEIGVKWPKVHGWDKKNG